MLRKLILTSVCALGAAVAFTGAAQAECRIGGIKYATGSTTLDYAGAQIHCNSRGTWQTAPLYNFAEPPTNYIPPYNAGARFDPYSLNRFYSQPVRRPYGYISRGYY